MIARSAVSPVCAAAMASMRRSTSADTSSGRSDRFSAGQYKSTPPSEAAATAMQGTQRTACCTLSVAAGRTLEPHARRVLRHVGELAALRCAALRQQVKSARAASDARGVHNAR